MTARLKLTDILNGAGGNFKDTWNSTEAAGDNGPLPPGEYLAHIASGELEKAKTKGTPGYKLVFEIIEGEHTGRRLYHDIWLTPAALPMAKRDLARIGITDPEQMERPIPRGIRCRLTVVQRKSEEGVPYNEVRRFEFVCIDAPPPNPFPPTAEGDEAGPDQSMPEGGRPTPDIPI
jgi:hypothetical protein